MQVCDTASPFTVCAHSYYMYEVTCLPLCHTEGEVTAVLSAITNICSGHNKNLVQCKFIALCLFQYTVPACYTFTRHADSLSTARTDPAYKRKVFMYLAPSPVGISTPVFPAPFKLSLNGCLLCVHRLHLHPTGIS